MSEPAASARIGELDLDAGGYESFYLRAVDPRSPRGVWLRHTVHKVPGRPAVGSVWIVLFGEDGPVAHKRTTPHPTVPPRAYIAVGGGSFGAGRIEGTSGDASWSLERTGDAPPLRHLPRPFLYTAPLPRTKLESPHPASRFSGTVTVAGRTYELDGWPGMVGHNWGAQHAERWIWLHAVFTDGWIDLALGRIKVAGRTTPWIANGALEIAGTRRRLGGIGRRAQVRETPTSLAFTVAGARGEAHSPRDQTVVWRYADPDGHEHHTANCSVAAVTLHAPELRTTAHGGAYELGMRETDHGLPVLPYTDP